MIASHGTEFQRRSPRFAAAAIALIAAAVCINRSVFSASISDASGYVAAAEALSVGRLARPVHLQLIPAIGDTGANTSPLGFRRGLISGTEVPLYPLGYPMLMSAAAQAGGELAMHLVTPVMFAGLVYCSFLIAQAMAGALAGLIAAVLVAGNAVAILNAVSPMSDVPATTCWIAAWYFAMRPSRGGASAAGALVALACMIRPNLLPLALVPGLLVLLQGAPTSPRLWQWTRALHFGAVALLGPLITAWCQYVLYGSAYRPGYPGWETFFQLAHIGPNLRTYPRLFVEVYGWLPLFGLGLVGWPSRLPSRYARVAATAALAIIVINVAVYLPYTPYDHWPFLRFFLPAIVALTVLFSVAIAVAVQSLRSRAAASWAAVAVLLAAAVVLWHGRDEVQLALSEWRFHARIPAMGHYLREVLPPSAVAFSYVHSGSVAHYTRHSTVSLESLAPQALDTLVQDLERYGCSPVFVIDESLEEQQFRSVFKGSTFAALDWPARAEFVSGSRIRYFVVADRERYRAGVRWPTDVLR